MPIGTVPPPSAHPDEPPIVCIPVNIEWIPILLGALQPLKYPEYWSGTLEENRRARKDFGLLIDQIMQLEDCGMASQCCEPTIYIYRFNPDTGRPERSPDDGTTWTPNPIDPLNHISVMPPIVRTTVVDTKCDAATNFSEHFNDLIAGCSENLGTATSVFELAAAIAGVLLEIFIIVVTGGAGSVVALGIVEAIFAACVAAFAEGKTAFDGYWTNANKDKILCAAKCTIGDDGKWTQAGWEAFKHKAKHDLDPSPALDMVLTSANAGGYVGANQMASYGAAAGADCSDCICDFCGVDWVVVDVRQDIPTYNSDTRTISGDATLISGNYYFAIKVAYPECCTLIAEFTGSGTPVQLIAPCDYTGDLTLDESTGWVNHPLAVTGDFRGLLWRHTSPFSIVVTFNS